jgi:hypothetical protein
LVNHLLFPSPSGGLALHRAFFVGKVRGIMQPREAYLDRVTTEVEDLASRVAVLGGRFAKQKVSVKLDHYWELEFVRTRFTEFKRRIEDLEYANEPELPRLQENVDAAWNELMVAVDTLMAALP